MREPLIAPVVPTCTQRFLLMTRNSMMALVAGAGFEPAIPRLRDYEPKELGENCEGSRPVAVQNPVPCFWALSCNSRRLASA